MRLKILGIVAAAIGLLPIVVLALAELWLTEARLRRLVVDQVRMTTGRELRISGPLDVDVLPAPRILVGDVGFANATWASTPDMLRLERLELAVDWFDLLMGRIDVHRLVLVRPEVFLEIDETGRSNWSLPPNRPDAAPDSPTPDGSSGAPPALVFDNLRLENGVVRFLDARTGRRDELRIQHVVGLMASDDSPIDLFAALIYDDIPISITGHVGNLPDILADQTVPVDLEITTAGATLTADGIVTAPRQGRGLALTLTLSGKQTGGLAALARAAVERPVSIPALGPYRLTLHVDGDAAAPGLSSLDVAIGDTDRVALALAGSVGTLWPVDGVDIALSVTLADPAPLTALNLPLPPTLPPTQVTGRVIGADGSFGLESLDLSVGRSRVQGAISVAPAERPIRVVAHLTAPLLDLVDVVPAAGSASSGGRAATDPAATPDDATLQTAGSNGQRLVPDTPLPLNALRRISADIHLKADRIVANRLDIGNAELRAFLKRGVFHVTQASGSVAGGRLDGSLTVDARQGDRASLHTGLSIDGIELGSVLRDAGADDTVEGAPIDVELHLAGAGATLRDLVTDLTGDVLVTLGDGRIQNTYLDLIGGDLLNGVVSFLNPFDESHSHSVLRCGVGAFVIQDGKLQIDRSVAVETEKTSVVIGGEVDLDTETLDIAVRTQSQGGFSVSAGLLARLIRLEGTLSAPNVGIDTYGMARAAASIAAAVATSGASLLAEAVWERMTQDPSPCHTALVRAKQRRNGTLGSD